MVHTLYLPHSYHHCTMGKCTSGGWPQKWVFQQLFCYFEKSCFVNISTKTPWISILWKKTYNIPKFCWVGQLLDAQIPIVHWEKAGNLAIAKCCNKVLTLLNVNYTQITTISSNWGKLKKFVKGIINLFSIMWNLKETVLHCRACNLKLTILNLIKCCSTELLQNIEKKTLRLNYANTTNRLQQSCRIKPQSLLLKLEGNCFALQSLQP